MGVQLSKRATDSNIRHWRPVGFPLSRQNSRGLVRTRKTGKTGCFPLIDYLKGKEDLTIVTHYHPSTAIYSENPGEVFHLLHLVGKKDDGILYCYIELFSSFKFKVMLSDRYEGADLVSTYCFDVLKSTVVEKIVHLDLSKGQLAEIFDVRPIYHDQMVRSISKLLKIAADRQVDHELTRIAEKAFDETIGKYPPGTNVTPGMEVLFLKAFANDYDRFGNRGKFKSPENEDFSQ